MTTDLRGNLEALGFPADAAARREALLTAAAAAVGSARAPGCRLYHVPGRIEVLGKHTDYAGGRSLVAATEHGLAVAAVGRADDLVRVLDVRSGERDEFRLATIAHRRGHWSDYFRVVAARLIRDVPGPWRGVEVAFLSDLPPAAGLSSSSALVITAALALGDANDLESRPAYRAEIRTPLDRAAWLGAVENGRPFAGFPGGDGVGTLGGAQDHTAILTCRPGSLTRLRFDPMEIESVVHLPDDLVFAIGVSGVRAEKTGAALDRYNAVARRTADLWEAVRDAAPSGSRSLGAALLDDSRVVGRMRARLEERIADPERRAALIARLDQLAAECIELIPTMEAALDAGAATAIGQIAARSQIGADAGLGNQIPETRALVADAVAAGALGASAFGAGFGGSVWALVPLRDGPGFLAAWQAAYQHRFPAHRESARFLLTRPAPAAARIHGRDVQPSFAG